MQASPDTVVSVASAQLADELLTFNRAIWRAGGSRFIAVLDELGITMTTMKMLLILGGNDEPQPMSTVAQALGLSLAATSRAAEDAVKRGLVHRQESEHDRRVKLLGLTDAGQQSVDELNAARRAGAYDFAELLSQEQRDAASAALQPLLSLIGELNLTCSDTDAEGRPA